MNHDDLTRLIRDAADGLEPGDRLGAIRHRTKGSTMKNRHQWWYAVAGAAAATAIILGSLALLGRGGDDTAPPVTGPTTTSPTTPTSPSSATDTAPPAATTPFIAYYVGSTAWGPRLFQETEFGAATGQDTEAAILQAVRAAMTGTPSDNSYRSPWPASADVESVSWQGGTATMDIALTPGLSDRPAGMSAQEAGMAVQQLVWTATTAAKADAPVQFVSGGQSMYTLLGVPVGEPLAKASALQTLNHVNILTPRQGDSASGNLKVTGLANSFEANVIWELIAGGQVVDKGHFTCDGWMADKLFPFSGTVPLGKAGTGDVVLRLSTDDPSGGAEGHGPYVDDKLIHVS